MWPNSLTTTRALKSVYSLSKKNEAIDALINYTQDVVIPSAHRLQRIRSDRGGEYTGLEYREYCAMTGIKQEFAERSHRSKMAFQNVSGRLYET